MARSPTQLGQDPAFERFLGAPVGEDTRGASVTVLSMLSRLDLDPWTEASDLARMQQGPARQRLDVLLSRFTDVPSLITGRGEVVSQLLSFLPGRVAPDKMLPDGLAARSSMSAICGQVFWIGAIVLLLACAFMLKQGN